MNLGLQGKTALVAGSTSGIGLAIAKALAGEGIQVALCGRRLDVAEREASSLPGAIGVRLDLTSDASVELAVDEVTGTFGGIDIVVLNGGGPPPCAASELTATNLAEWLSPMLLAQIHLVSLVLPKMRASGWGRVLAVGSSGVQQPIPHLAISNIARSALAAYLKTLAGEVARDGVTVNLVLPGRIDTERVAALDKNAAARDGVDVTVIRDRSQAAIPLGRYGRPEEFGDVAAFLCSDRASYVTGAQIRVDGGAIVAL
jgi:3-oxoacyl-[acyl-carrier protein] reductase